MVEVNIEFLAGVAVTVFLALLFFGVVVLWDVALALRSVGDKIDKLEDNIDDDLTDIGHSLDGLGTASGGGTQLHLSGGTISSGAGTGGQHAGQPAGAPQAGAAGPVQHPGQTPGGQQHGGAEARADARAGSPEADDTGPAPADDRARAHPDERVSTSDEPPNERDSSSRDSSEDEPDADPAGSDDATGDEADGDESGPEEHPRAALNRGRFVTSPDTTAWYATPLDREAIRNPGPEIAGVLESSDESDDVFAAEPGDPDEEDEEEPVVAAPPPDAAPGDESAAPRTTDDGAGDSRPEVGNDDSAGSPSETTGDGETTDSEPSDGEPDTDDDVETTGTELSFGEESDDSSGADGSTADRSEEGPGEASGPDGSTVDQEPAVRGEVTADGVEIEARDVELPDDASTPEDGQEAVDERPAGDGTDEEATDADSTTGSDEANDGATDGESAEFTEFELEDVSDLGEDEAEDDVSVDEAVETMNDDAPALSLSSHDFDVTAEADEESATLIFEFDPATVELTGSTRRLLRYQLSSFAERSDTPDGEITIEGQTLVIELPATDGRAIQRWGEAAVSVIDRTLYLSDDSE